jgi:hypothetical protein
MAGNAAAWRGVQMATVQEIADAMYNLVKEYKGKKQYTARELTKEMANKFGSDANRSTCKEALRLLMDSGRCVYTYKGGSYVEVADE